MEFEMKRI